MSLTDEQINKIESTCWDGLGFGARFDRRKYARAIESAATAPLLEKIAELERECVSLRNTLEALRKDAERWAMSHLVSKEVLTPPEKRQHQNVLNAYFKATGAGLDWVASIDAAIDAAKDRT